MADSQPSVAGESRRDADGARHAVEEEIVEGSRLLDRLMREANWYETAGALLRAVRGRRATRK